MWQWNSQFPGRPGVQVMAIVWLAPWLPGWRGGGVLCRMQTAADRGRCGVVSIGFGDGNPAADAVARLSPPRRTR